MNSTRRALLLALAALLLLVPTAQAFPGRNGAFVYGWSELQEPDLGPATHVRDIRTIHTIGGRSRTLRGCIEVDGVPTAGDCTLSAYRDPAFSPDGRTIAFDAGDVIAVIPSRPQGWLRLLPAHEGDDGEPAFAPNGTQLVFSSGPAGAQPDTPRNLWTIDLLVGVLRPLVKDGSDPVWSVRNRIAFVRSGAIWIVRPDGSHLRQLTHGSHDVSPTFSPDGTKLAFSRGGDIYVRNLISHSLRRVAKGTGAVDLVWSPDGRRFLVGMFDGGAYTVGTNGQHTRQIVAGGTGGTYNISVAGLDWQPRP